MCESLAKTTTAGGYRLKMTATRHLSGDPSGECKKVTTSYRRVNKFSEAFKTFREFWDANIGSEIEVTLQIGEFVRREDG